ncbi:tetratricopeptide repeat protein [Candidatus Puniceispirillum sp.]|uniref:tetratricopeptide repeat protein n=1 Tax=Candidatus Puniceispirillum sp. TaxID=2026719 RepID=UPI002FCE42D6
MKKWWLSWSLTSKASDNSAALAEQGDAEAQNDLGTMYYNGIGAPQDYAKALKWYRLAAEKGLAAAQYNLGIMYGRGEGVPQDDVRAHMWGNLARAKGVENADALIKELETHMSHQQVATAQAMARQCLRQDYKNCDKL